METIFAEILGRHTAEVIQCASGLIPKEMKVDRRTQSPPLCELAVRIDFNGCLAPRAGDKSGPPAEGSAAGGQVSGYVLCGFIRQDQSRSVLTAMARHLHLGDDLIDSPDGPINLLKEFLNIVIGLTGAEWADQGFDMDFSPPRDLSGQLIPAPTPEETAFHVVVEVESGTRVDLWALFRG